MKKPRLDITRDHRYNSDMLALATDCVTANGKVPTLYLFINALMTFLILGVGFSSQALAETNVTISTTLTQLNESKSSLKKPKGIVSAVVVKVQNIGESPLLYPIKVVIDSISSSDVTVINADGVTFEGKPYFTYNAPPENGDNIFHSLSSTHPKNWKFYNPTKALFTYQTTVFGSRFVAELATPSEVTEVPHPLIGGDITVREYTGRLEFPEDINIQPESLFVESGIAGQTAVTPKGFFNVAMNSDGTTLLSVITPNSNVVMMKAFPKGEYLGEVNPVINTKSTAVALVALQPGFLTTVPQLDAMLLAIISSLAETDSLADRLAIEIEQGTFNAKGAYSDQINQNILAVNERFIELRAEDVFELGPITTVNRYLNKFIDIIIPPAYAALFAENCIDGFTSSFTGNPDNPDEVCIATNLQPPGEDSYFGILNRKSRWVVFTETEIRPGAFFDWLPPRHISVPGIGELFLDAVLLLDDVGCDLLIVDAWQTFFDSCSTGGNTDQALQDITNSYFGSRESQSSYVFPTAGEYNLATVGFSITSSRGDRLVDSWEAPSLVLTLTTEVVIPTVGILLEFGQTDIDNGILSNSSQECFKGKHLAWIADLGASTVQKLSETDGPNGKEFLIFLWDNLFSKKETYAFVACLAGDKAGAAAVDKMFNKVLDSSVGVAFKVGQALGQAQNILVAYRDAFNSDIAAIDRYKAIIGVISGPLVSLEAIPSSIEIGESTTLNWSSSNSSSCTGEKFSSDDSTSGSVSVSPTETTTYTLTCSGAGGTETTTATVTVGAVPPNVRYLMFEEGNPGIEDDGVFVSSSNINFTTFSFTTDPKPLVGTLNDGVTITVITKLPRNDAYAQIYYEFGYLGTQCLVRVQDNNVVFPQKITAEATYYSLSVMSNITQAVRDEISTSGAIITSSLGCAGVNVSGMFFNRIELLSFGVVPIELDAVILDSGLVNR